VKEMKKTSFVLLLCYTMLSPPALGLLQFNASAQKIVTAGDVNGTWRTKTATFKVWALGHQKLRVEFLGTYEYNTPAGLMANSGTGSGIARIEGDTATFKPDDGDEECKITMRFMGGKLIVTQEGGCGFGHNVSAEGTYRKVSSRKPKFGEY
jgi:hypothetical protein